MHLKSNKIKRLIKFVNNQMTNPCLVINYNLRSSETSAKNKVSKKIMNLMIKVT